MVCLSVTCYLVSGGWSPNLDRGLERISKIESEGLNNE